MSLKSKKEKKENPKDNLRQKIYSILIEHINNTSKDSVIIMSTLKQNIKLQTRLKGVFRRWFIWKSWIWPFEINNKRNNPCKFAPTLPKSELSIQPLVLQTKDGLAMGSNFITVSDSRGVYE